MPKRASAPVTSIPPSSDSPPAKKLRTEGSPGGETIPSDSAYPELSEGLKKHCKAFVPTPPTDKDAFPKPFNFFRNGGARFDLCNRCFYKGRNMQPIPLEENLSGVVVPLCPTCCKANTRSNWAIFFGPTIKSMVDYEQYQASLAGRPSRFPAPESKPSKAEDEAEQEEEKENDPPNTPVELIDENARDSVV